jgi:hypothetical protein
MTLDRLAFLAAADLAIAANRQQGLIGGAEPEELDCLGMTCEHGPFLSRDWVPEADGSVLTGAGQDLAAILKRQRQHRARMAIKR